MLQHSADHASQIFSLGVRQVDGMIDRVPSSGQELNPSARIYGRGEDDLLKEIPVHVVGAGEGEEKALPFQETERLKIEIFISSRSAREVSFLFRKRRRIENDDVIIGFKAPHHFKSISPDQMGGDPF